MELIGERSKKDIVADALDKALEIEEVPADKLAEDMAAADERLSVIIGKLNDAEDIEFGYSDFITICADDDEKEEDYLGFYQIDRRAGVFVQDIPDDIHFSLIKEEKSFLSEHPLKDLNRPILPFPFTATQLKVFMQWSANRGIEVPIDDEALDKAIAKNRQEEAQASALCQQKRLTQKDIETSPDEVGAMPEEAKAIKQPPQKCDPQEDSETQVSEPTQQVSIAQRLAESKNKSKPAQRVETIRHWFDEQNEFTATNLRASQTGKYGARDACWQWLGAQGFTQPGRIFGGVLQSGSTKSKSFVNAWSEFLKHIEKNQT